jgi:hypothetical protein
MSDWIARSDVTDAVLSDCVVMFEAVANRQLRVRQMEASSTLTPASGEATLPTDYLMWRSVTWEGSPTQQLEYVEPRWMRAAYNSTDADTPTVFTIEGTTFSLRPTSTTSVTFRYWQKIPALSDSNTTNWLLTAHPDVYLHGCLYEVYKYLRDSDGAVAYIQLRDAGFEEIKKLSEKTKGPVSLRLMGTII